MLDLYATITGVNKCTWDILRVDIAQACLSRGEILALERECDPQRSLQSIQGECWFGSSVAEGVCDGYECEIQQ